MEKRVLLVLAVLTGVILGAVAVELIHSQAVLTVKFLDEHHNGITAATAVLALLVSLGSIGLAAYSMAAQRAHNRTSVMPIGNISVGDYEEDVFVRLRNDGVGPLVVEKLIVTARKTGETKNSIIDFMPDGIWWSTFVKKLEGRAISPEKWVTLIQLQGSSRSKRFKQAKQRVRKALSNLEVKVEYKNIYDEAMPPASRILDWFARH